MKDDYLPSIKLRPKTLADSFKGFVKSFLIGVMFLGILLMCAFGITVLEVLFNY